MPSIKFTKSLSDSTQPTKKTRLRIHGRLIAMMFWCVVVFSHAVSATDPLFGPSQVYQCGDSPRSVIAADLNGDGHQDLAVTNAFSNDVSILLNDGEGTFLTAVNYQVGMYPYAVIAADFNSDGDKDLAIPNWNSNNLTILYNSGSGAFDSSISLGGGNGASSVVAADFDSDSRIDVAVTYEASNWVHVYRNNGNGSFSSTGVYPVGDFPGSIATSDLNGDGKHDLVVATPGSNSISILLNTGNGMFASSVNYSGLVGPGSVCVSDCNGDGWQDVLVANSNRISRYLNNGNGTFGSLAHYTGVNGPSSLILNDFDLDGDNDLTVANHNSNNISLFRNAGDCSFSYYRSYSVGTEPYSVYSSDFNSDNILDLVVANSGSDNVTVYMSLETCLPPLIVSKSSDTALYDSDYRYRGEIVGGTAENTSLQFLNIPSWLQASGDSLAGFVLGTVVDTSFDMIATNLCGADTIHVVVDFVRTTPGADSLKVESVSSNLHVTDHLPLFAWDFSPYDGGSPQSQFEIAVGTDNNWAFAEKWNPAPFASADTFVVYDGSTLVDGATYYVRLRVNNGIAWSPWFESSFRMNSVPTTPVPINPINDAAVGNLPYLYCLNAIDAENDTRTYQFEVYADSALTILEWQGTNTEQPTDTSFGQVGAALTENARFWWRVRSYDGFEYSPWSPANRFRMNAQQQSPSAFGLVYPADEETIFDMLPTMSWTASTDPDPSDFVRYKMEISLTPSFSFVLVKDSLTTNSYALTDSLFFGTHYYWRVTARDATGLTVASIPSSGDFWTWELGDVDYSHSTDIGDLTMLVDHLFISFDPILPLKLADLNGDCSVDIGDLTVLVDHLFISFAPLVPGCE